MKGNASTDSTKIAPPISVFFGEVKERNTIALKPLSTPKNVAFGFPKPTRRTNSCNERGEWNSASSSGEPIPKVDSSALNSSCSRSIDTETFVKKDTLDMKDKSGDNVYDQQNDYEVENEAKVAAMTSQEIDDAMKEIASIFSTKSIEFMKSRALKNVSKDHKSGKTVPSQSQSLSMNLSSSLKPNAVENSINVDRNDISMKSHSQPSTIKRTEAKKSQSLDLHNDPIDIINRQSYKYRYDLNGTRVVMNTNELIITMKETLKQYQPIESSLICIRRNDNRFDILMDHFNNKCINSLIDIGMIRYCDPDRVPEVQFQDELFNHQSEPEAPGYSIHDISELFRSSVLTQRSLGLQMIHGIIMKRDLITSMEAYGDVTLKGMESSDGPIISSRMNSLEYQFRPLFSTLIHDVLKLFYSFDDCSGSDDINMDQLNPKIIRDIKRILVLSILSITVSDLPTELPTLLLWAVQQKQYFKIHTQMRVRLWHCILDFCRSIMEERAYQELGDGFLGGYGYPILPIPHARRVEISYEEYKRDCMTNRIELSDADSFNDSKSLKSSLKSRPLHEKFALECRWNRWKALLNFSDIVVHLMTEIQEGLQALKFLLSKIGNMDYDHIQSTYSSFIPSAHVVVLAFNILILLAKNIDNESEADELIKVMKALWTGMEDLMTFEFVEGMDNIHLIHLERSKIIDAWIHFLVEISRASQAACKWLWNHVKLGEHMNTLLASTHVRIKMIMTIMNNPPGDTQRSDLTVSESYAQYEFSTLRWATMLLRVSLKYGYGVSTMNILLLAMLHWNQQHEPVHKVGGENDMMDTLITSVLGFNAVSDAVMSKGSYLMKQFYIDLMNLFEQAVLTAASILKGVCQAVVANPLSMSNHHELLHPVLECSLTLCRLVIPIIQAVPTLVTQYMYIDHISSRYDASCLAVMFHFIATVIGIVGERYHMQWSRHGDATNTIPFTSSSKPLSKQPMKIPIVLIRGRGLLTHCNDFHDLILKFFNDEMKTVTHTNQYDLVMISTLSHQIQNELMTIQTSFLSLQHEVFIHWKHSDIDSDNKTVMWTSVGTSDSYGNVRRNWATKELIVSFNRLRCSFLSCLLHEKETVNREDQMQSRATNTTQHMGLELDYRHCGNESSFAVGDIRLFSFITAFKSKDISSIKEALTEAIIHYFQTESFSSNSVADGLFHWQIHRLNQTLSLTLFIQLQLLWWYDAIDTSAVMTVLIKLLKRIELHYQCYSPVMMRYVISYIASYAGGEGDDESIDMITRNILDPHNNLRNDTENASNDIFFTIYQGNIINTSINSWRQSWRQTAAVQDDSWLFSNIYQLEPNSFHHYIIQLSKCLSLTKFDGHHSFFPSFLGDIITTNCCRILFLLLKCCYPEYSYKWFPELRKAIIVSLDVINQEVPIALKTAYQNLLFFTMRTFFDRGFTAPVVQQFMDIVHRHTFSSSTMLKRGIDKNLSLYRETSLIEMIEKLMEACTGCYIDHDVHAMTVLLFLLPSPVLFPWKIRERIWRSLTEVRLIHLIEPEVDIAEELPGGDGITMRNNETILTQLHRLLNFSSWYRVPKDLTYKSSHITVIRVILKALLGNSIEEFPRYSYTLAVKSLHDFLFDDILRHLGVSNDSIIPAIGRFTESNNTVIDEIIREASIIIQKEFFDTVIQNDIPSMISSLFGSDVVFEGFKASILCELVCEESKQHASLIHDNTFKQKIIRDIFYKLYDEINGFVRFLNNEPIAFPLNMNTNNLTLSLYLAILHIPIQIPNKYIRSFHMSDEYSTLKLGSIIYY